MPVDLNERFIELVKEQNGDPELVAQEVEALLQRLTGNTSSLVFSVSAYLPSSRKPNEPIFGHVSDDMAESFPAGKPLPVGHMSEWDE